MPTTAKPRYHKKAGLWYANVGPPDSRGRATEVWMRGRLGRADEPRGPGDERAAWRWLEAWQDERRRAAAPPAPAALTVADVCERYLQWCEGRVVGRSLKRADYLNRVSCLSRACETLGAVPVGDLAADHHAAMVAALRGAGLSKHYQRGVHRVLMGALNWAARPPARLVAANPLAGVRPPATPRVRGRYVGREGIAQLWVWAAGRARQGTPHGRHFDRAFLRYLAFLLATGCRPGEAIRLRWGQIDWSRQLAVLADHKTAESTGRDRVIPLPPRAVRTLRRLQADERRHPEFVFVHRPAKGRGKATTAVERRCGQPWADAQAAARALRRLRRAAIDAGCELADDGPGRLTAYSARYRSITDQLARGLPPAVVARIHGNSPKMVVDVYEQMEEEGLARLLGEMEER